MATHEELNKRYAEKPLKASAQKVGETEILHAPCPHCGRTVSTSKPDKPAVCICGFGPYALTLASSEQGN